MVMSSYSLSFSLEELQQRTENVVYLFFLSNSVRVKFTRVKLLNETHKIFVYGYAGKEHMSLQYLQKIHKWIKKKWYL
jgi:hypothetical protein